MRQTKGAEAARRWIERHFRLGRRGQGADQDQEVRRLAVLDRQRGRRGRGGGGGRGRGQQADRQRQRRLDRRRLDPVADVHFDRLAQHFRAQHAPIRQSRDWRGLLERRLHQEGRDTPPTARSPWRILVQTVVENTKHRGGTNGCGAFLQQPAYLKEEDCIQQDHYLNPPSPSPPFLF